MRKAIGIGGLGVIAALASATLLDPVTQAVGDTVRVVTASSSLEPLLPDRDAIDPTTPTPDCTTVTSSAGALGPAPGTARCGLASRVTLQDRVYFGAYWQILDRDPAAAALVLGDGYADARVERSSDGKFFAGTVEKRDARGAVTDVILAFAGADGGPDAVQGESILLGIPLEESARATALYDRLLAEPRYAGARIHVTGHSLGAGYTQFVLAHALAQYGESATDRRADFLGFGAPNWAGSAARHFGLERDAVAQRMVDFTAADDPVLINGVERVGINTYLPAFWGLTGIGAALNVVAAHWPTTYAAALGLPGWLSASQQAAATASASAQFNTGDSNDPAYGPAGTLPLVIDGTPGREWLQGMGGADRLYAGRGADVLTGGRGWDLFVYRTAQDGGDVISDFAQSEGDRIDLSAFATLLDRVRFAGSTGFGGGREARYAWRGGETSVEVDLNGDRAADLSIRLSGRVSLRADDFVL